MSATTTRCQAITKKGRRCRAPAVNGSDFCFWHAPEKAAERKVACVKGGRARHGRSIGTTGQQEDPVTLASVADVVKLIERAINDAMRLENSLSRGNVIARLADVALRALTLDTLEQRVAALELLAERRDNDFR